VTSWLAAVGCGSAAQGSSVGLSGDGNTAIVGGFGDSSGAGAAWIFTRSGGAWSQQPKLIGTGASGTAHQGASVALSADGNTALVGGSNDTGGTGAVWVFVRGSGGWSQQGGKLVGSGSVGNSHQGASISLSADGNTAIVGGYGDNNGAGAAWAFTPSGGVWSQLGAKLVGTGATGNAFQGSAIALSGDGNIAIVGGPADNTSAGAAWLFVRSIAKLDAADTHDNEGGGVSSIGWRQSGGAMAIWAMAPNATIFRTFSYGTVPANWQIVGQRDFNNDGIYDFLWRDGASGTAAIWLLNGTSVQQSGSLGAVPLNWSVAGTSDFNYDGHGDILWRDGNTGTVAIWLLNGLSVVSSGSLGVVPLNWTIAATDGRGDIFWRDTSTGTLAIWQVYGFEVLQTASLGTVPLGWTIAGVGDFDGNGSTDILWRDGNTGTLAIWLMSGFSVMQTGSLGAVPSNWVVAETGDFNGDYKSDILWRDTSAGTVAIWFMNRRSRFGSAPVSQIISST
jgi:FG-GAP-like repeat